MTQLNTIAQSIMNIFAYIYVALAASAFVWAVVEVLTQ